MHLWPPPSFLEDQTWQGIYSGQFPPNEYFAATNVTAQPNKLIIVSILRLNSEVLLEKEQYLKSGGILLPQVTSSTGEMVALPYNSPTNGGQAMKIIPNIATSSLERREVNLQELCTLEQLKVVADVVKERAARSLVQTSIAALMGDQACRSDCFSFGVVILRRLTDAYSYYSMRWACTRQARCGTPVCRLLCHRCHHTRTMPRFSIATIVFLGRTSRSGRRILAATLPCWLVLELAANIIASAILLSASVFIHSPLPSHSSLQHVVHPTTFTRSFPFMKEMRPTHLPVMFRSVQLCPMTNWLCPTPTLTVSPWAVESISRLVSALFANAWQSHSTFLSICIASYRNKNGLRTLSQCERSSECCSSAYGPQE